MEVMYGSPYRYFKIIINTILENSLHIDENETKEVNKFENSTTCSQAIDSHKDLIYTQIKLFSVL